MKTITLLVCLLFSAIAFAQQPLEDIIYLKDGLVLRGKITERLSDGAVKMTTNQGREITVSMREIKSINIGGIGTSVADYGTDKAIGISLFGEGGFGLHYRFKVAKESWGDVSVQPDIIALQSIYTDKIKVSGGLGLAGEFDHFVSRRFKESKQRVRGNGLFFRAYHGFNSYSTTIISAGWVSEYFKLNRYKRGFLLNLGPALKFNHWVDDPINAAYTEGVESVEPTIVFRIQWNFFK